MPPQRLEGNRLWHRVWSLAEQVRAKTPEGTVGVVDIETVDGRTFRPWVLQEQPPWVLIEVGPESPPTDRDIILLREDHITRIVISRESESKQRVGFSLGDVGGD